MFLYYIMVSFNIVLNSLNRVTGGATNDCQYNFDWNSLPQGKYKVNFTYMGSLNSINGSRIASFFCDLGQSKVFSTNINATNSVSTRNLGVLTYNGLGLISAYNFNSPIFLDSKPNNNIFSVQVLDTLGIPFIDDTGNILKDYVVILHFEMV